MRLERISLRGASLGRVPLPRISLQGKGGDAPLDFSGYPLALSLPNARSMKNYTLFGNTSEDAKGVGDEVVNLVKCRNFSYTWDDGFSVQVSTDGRAILNGTATSVKSVNLALAGEGGAITYAVGEKYCFVINSPVIRIRIGNDFYSGMGNKVAVSTVANTQVPALEINAGTYDNVVLYPMIFKLSDTKWADVTTPDDFAHRLGYADAAHLPPFPYGSSFVAPIRVGSRNLWDEEWVEGTWNPTEKSLYLGNRISSAGRIAVKPQTDYFFKGNFAYGVYWYDADDNYLIADYPTNRKITSPSNAYYMRFTCGTAYGTTYNHDLCINLSDEHNGEYSPYFAPTLYPSVLSSPLHKIGDIVDYKESNGKEWHGLVQAMPESLTWTYRGEISVGIFSSIISDRKVSNNTTVRIANYTFGGFVDTATAIGTKADKTIWLYYNPNLPTARTIYIKDTSLTSVADFLAANSGSPIVYELATPTEVQGEPLPRLAIPRGTSIVTLDTEVEPSNITAKV